MDFETRLTSLGQHLDLDDGDALSERVMARIDVDDVDGDGRRGRWLGYAAAVLVVAAIAAVAVPSSRDTIAGWFGLDGVRIERRQDVETPRDTSLVPVIAGDVSGLPGPGDSREVTVDGRVVLVSVIEGVLADEVLVKTLGPDTDIVEVTVGDAPGLWISGAPHDLAYLPPEGTIVFERVAGNTLVWQDDQMIGRVEGFESVGAAIEFATALGTND
jgi:hypothetical protein